MQARPRILNLLPLLITALWLAGCASSTHPSSARIQSNPEVLFSPAWTGLTTFDLPRSDWPSTTAFDRNTEVIDFQEITIDRLTGNESQRDLFYRRTEVIRSETAYR